MGLQTAPIGDGQFAIEYLNGKELAQLALAADTLFFFPEGADICGKAWLNFCNYSA